MNTRQKKILLGGAIVALILVATIVVVVVIVSNNGNLTSTITEDELLAEFKKLVKADEHTRVVVQVRVVLKDGGEHDGKIVHDFKEAKEFAIKQVEIRGTNVKRPFNGVNEDQIDQKIASMKLIGQRMVIGNPIFRQVKGTVSPGHGHLVDLKDILQVDDVTFYERYRCNDAGELFQKKDGDETVHYLQGNR